MICNFRVVSENFMHVAAWVRKQYVSVLVFGCTFKLFVISHDFGKK